MNIATSQTAKAVLMVRPTSFGFDVQTAATNSFQQKGSLQPSAILRHALEEFDKAVAALRAQDITVVVFEDTDPIPKPNAVFPNNWLTTWPDGEVYVYPMATESRRTERSPAVLEELRQQYELQQVNDLSSTERVGQYLEGTGAMVFDHLHKIVYGCLSPRCNERLFTAHAAELGYAPVVFAAVNRSGVAIYHTNVMFGVQTSTAVICGSTIHNPHEHQAVFDSLRRTDHTIIDISEEQMDHFCGNLLELQNAHGRRFLVMSKAAYGAFSPHQLSLLGRDKTILALDIPTIEAIGGGSARCMLAELFLPVKQPTLVLSRQR